MVLRECGELVWCGGGVVWWACGVEGMWGVGVVWWGVVLRECGE